MSDVDRYKKAAEALLDRAVLNFADAVRGFLEVVKAYDVDFGVPAMPGRRSRIYVKAFRDPCTVIAIVWPSASWYIQHDGKYNPSRSWDVITRIKIVSAVFERWVDGLDEAIANCIREARGDPNLSSSWSGIAIKAAESVGANIVWDDPFTRSLRSKSLNLDDLRVGFVGPILSASPRILKAFDPEVVLWLVETFDAMAADARRKGDIVVRWIQRKVRSKLAQRVIELGSLESLAKG